MRVLYIGQSGPLNRELHKALKEECDLTILSNQSISNSVLSKLTNDYDTVVLGGRKINLESFSLIRTKSSDYKFLSTFKYEGYRDSYQLEKEVLETELSKMKVSLLKIPFIKEMLPEKVRKMLAGKKVNENYQYYISMTSIQAISNVLNKKDESLNVQKIGIHTSKFESLMIRFFHYLYRKGTLLDSRATLNTIKIIEKTTTSLLKLDLVSAVFIGVMK